jgi:hypothetical protein
MSFSVFRASLRSAAVAPLRRTAAQAPNCNKILFRNTLSRKYSTESTPPPLSPQFKAKLKLYIGIGAALAVVTSLSFNYYYEHYIASGKEIATAAKSRVQAAKVKVNFVPSKEDYIKVNQSLFFLLRLSLISSVLGRRYTTKLSTSLTKLANMMVHSIVIRVLSKPPPLHVVNL